MLRTALFSTPGSDDVATSPPVGSATHWSVFRVVQTYENIFCEGAARRDAARRYRSHRHTTTSNPSVAASHTFASSHLVSSARTAPVKTAMVSHGSSRH